MRRQARTQGRPVVELAREVLDGLATDPAPQAVAAALAPPGAGGAPVPRSQRAVRSAVIADGRS
jgi:hypothetical protein